MSTSYVEDTKFNPSLEPSYPKGFCGISQSLQVNSEMAP